MNTSNRRWAIFAAVVTGVVIASLVPLPGGDPERFLFGVGLDKWAHVVGYAVVSSTFARAWRDADSPAPWRVGLVAIAVGFSVGAGVELLQEPLATRTASVADAGANAVGAASGAVLWRLRNS